MSNISDPYHKDYDPLFEQDDFQRARNYLEEVETIEWKLANNKRLTKRERAISDMWEDEE